MSVVLIKDASHAQVHQGLVCLGETVTSEHWQQNVVTSPVQRGVVIAAIRGEIVADTIKPQDWLDREVAASKGLAKCGLPEFDPAEVEKAAKMGVGLYDRFIPGDLHRRQLLEACVAAGVKLRNSSVEGADCGGNEMSTVASVFTLDYRSIFLPTDADHRPFMLNYDQQWAWAAEQGGEGFSTVEEFIYVVVLRPWIELGRLPYMGGSSRCQNAAGSAHSLHVRFDADTGLHVYYWHRSHQHWPLWALPRKSRELGS